MIRAIYLELGFFMTILMCVVFVIGFIFWISGIAGLLSSPDRKRPPNVMTYVLCILVPIYPIFWLVNDMIRQHIKIRKNGAIVQD